MSWSGFKKNVGRATTQVMMKTGHVEKTSDRDYEVEERRYRTLESASLRLQKEAKGYLDSLRAMTASQMRIAETIDAFYGDSGAKDGVSRSYKQAVEDLDAETVKALDGPYRCVSRYPKLKRDIPPPPREDQDEGEYRAQVLAEVEAELNFAHGNRRHWTEDARKAMPESEVLMEYVYRTTVLEPINRFCAYFPDINECIKKRNHKMLDYDAMRSKVKKLTEKPDKDPGKLPRTEKETEMVNPTHHPKFSFFSDDLAVLLAKAEEEASVFPSPPKVLDGLSNRNPTKEDALAKTLAEDDVSIRSLCIRHRPSFLGRVSRVSSAACRSLLRTPQDEHRPGPRESLLRSSTSIGSSQDSWHGLNMESPCSSQPLPLFAAVALPSDKDNMPPQPSSLDPPKVKKRAITLTAEHLEERKRRLVNMPVHPAFRTALAIKEGFPPTTPTSRSGPRGDTPRTSQGSRKSDTLFNPKTVVNPARGTGNWFNPSELEEMLRPLKEAFTEQQADLFQQARAAYEQLNDQLTDELPKLIDLRVPYLDPSFEALVKIQLRFCAEAYSRMAQVQQYLDASTRDQYASGDLDARVEDVLGQIRELSIAGTV